MSTAKRGLKNSGYYLFIEFLPYFTSVVSIPILTSSLQPSEYGFFALCQSLLSLLIIPAGLQIHSSIVPMFTRIDDRNSPKERAHRLSTLFFAALTGSLLLSFGLSWVPNALLLQWFPADSEPMLPALRSTLWVGLICTSLSLILREHLRSQEKGNFLVRIAIVQSVLNLVLYVALLRILHLGLHGVLISNMATWVVNFLCLLFLNRKNLSPYFSKAYFKEALHFSGPMIPHAASSFVFLYSDRLLLRHFVAAGDLGLYAFADRLAGLLKTFTESLMQGFSVSLMHLLKKDSDPVRNREISAIAHLYFLLACTGCSMGLLFSREVFVLLIGTQFYPAYALIAILSLAYFLRSPYSIFSTLFLFHRRTGAMAKINIIAGVVNIALNFFLIPRFGVWGAASSTLVAMLFQSIASVWQLQGKWSDELKIFSPQNLWPLVGTAASVFLFFISRPGEPFTGLALVVIGIKVVIASMMGFAAVQGMLLKYRGGDLS